MKKYFSFPLRIILFSASLSLLTGCGLIVEILGFGEIGGLAVEGEAIAVARAASITGRGALAEGMVARSVITRTAAGRLLITDNSAFISQASRVRVVTSAARNPRLYVFENGTKIEIGEIEATNSIKVWDTKTRYLFKNGRLVHTKQRLNVLGGPGENYQILYSLEKDQLILKLESNFPGWAHVANTDAAGNTVYGYVNEALLVAALIPNPVASKNCDVCHGNGQVMKMIECSYCASSGKNKCPYCNGKGSSNCNSCRGQKRITCVTCQGRMSFACSACSGVGSFSCSTCRSSGVLQTPYGLRQCTICSGTKRNRCYNCGGDGAINCFACDQKGYNNCFACKGTGTNNCYVCKQTGQVSCNHCNGAGAIQNNIKCGKCEGSGTVYYYINKP